MDNVHHIYAIDDLQRVLEINVRFFLDGSNVCLEFRSLESIRSPSRNSRNAAPGSFKKAWNVFLDCSIED